MVFIEFKVLCSGFSENKSKLSIVKIGKKILFQWLNTKKSKLQWFLWNFPFASITKCGPYSILKMTGLVQILFWLKFCPCGLILFQFWSLGR